MAAVDALTDMDAKTVIQLAIAALLAVVWSVVFLNAYVIHPTGPQPPAVFSAPVVAAITGLFGDVIRRQVKRNGNGNGS